MAATSTPQLWSVLADIRAKRQEAVATPAVEQYQIPRAVEDMGSASTTEASAAESTADTSGAGSSDGWTCGTRGRSEEGLANMNAQKRARNKAKKKAVATPAVATPAVATPAVATPAVATPAVATPAVAPQIDFRLVAVFGLEERSKQLLDDWKIRRCHAKQLLTELGKRKPGSSSISCLILPSTWLRPDGSLGHSAPNLAHEYAGIAASLGAQVMGWDDVAARFAGRCGEDSASAVAAGKKRSLDQVAAEAKQARKSAKQSAYDAGMGREEALRRGNEAAKRCQHKAAVEHGVLTGDPAALAERARLDAFLARVALYLSFCPGRAATTEQIGREVMRWAPGDKWVPGKTRLHLWARRDHEFECSGNLKIAAAGCFVRLRGEATPERTAALDVAAVTATVAVKPSAAKWLGRRQLYNRSQPDAASCLAMDALSACLDMNAGLSTDEPSAPPALPDGWFQAHDAAGRPYFYRWSNGVPTSTWELPTEPSALEDGGGMLYRVKP